MKRRWAGGLLLALACAGFSSCRVDDEIDDRAWPCATSADCGTQDGKAMICWQRFCMPSCRPDEPVPDGFECVHSGALLKTCDIDAGDCPPNLNCYRTDLLDDVGLCVPMPVCSEDADCNPGDTARSTCASTLLVNLNETIKALGAQNLQCVQSPCGEIDGSSCGGGEKCLDKQYDLPEGFPAICAPRCDGRLECPLNFACARVNLATGAEDVCVPGLPGVRCGRSEDCIVGECLPTGAGFSICTLGCKDQDTCALLSVAGPHFWCIEGNGDRLCAAMTPFHGPDCNVKMGDADCPADLRCSDYSPYGPNEQDQGECRVACDGPGSCPYRAGVPHVCLAGGEGGCYPADFGVPCAPGVESCLPPFSCTLIQPDGREVRQETAVCTTSCRSDDECIAEPATSGSAYCDGTVCRLRALPGRPCDRPEQCKSGVCMADGRCG